MENGEGKNRPLLNSSKFRFHSGFFLDLPNGLVKIIICGESIILFVKLSNEVSK
jgi:hypothetical protein